MIGAVVGGAMHSGGRCSKAGCPSSDTVPAVHQLVAAKSRGCEACQKTAASTSPDGLNCSAPFVLKLVVQCLTLRQALICMVDALLAPCGKAPCLAAAMQSSACRRDKMLLPSSCTLLLIAISIGQHVFCLTIGRIVNTL